jgi:hypothetical protein
MRMRLAWACVLLLWALPASAGTYYVRTTGDDTTGDGTTGTPWKTLTKAFATVAIGGNHTINVGDGTYQENTSATGYWLITQSFAAEVIVQSETGNASAVIVQGASAATFDVRCNGCANITFKNLTFQPRLATNTSAFKLISGNTTNLEFDGVRFITATGEALSIAIADATALDGLTVTNCTFSQTGANTVYGMHLQTLLTGTAANIAISNSTFTMTGASTAFYLHRQLTGVTITNVTASNTGAGTVARVDGVTTLAVSGLTATSTGGAGGVPFIVGADSDTGLASSGVTLTNITATAAESHGMLIGALVNGATVSNIVVNGGDHGLVLKSCTDVTVSNAQIHHKGGSGILLKGAAGSIVQDSTVVSLGLTAGSSSIGIAVSGATTTSGCTVRRVRTSARGSAVAFAWAAAADGGTNTVDNNIYSLCGSGKFGVVQADADVQTITELLAAWDGYGAGTNDENSRQARNTSMSIGRRPGVWTRSAADCDMPPIGRGPGLY